MELLKTQKRKRYFIIGNLGRITKKNFENLGWKKRITKVNFILK